MRRLSFLNNHTSSTNPRFLTKIINLWKFQIFFIKLKKQRWKIIILIMSVISSDLIEKKIMFIFILQDSSEYWLDPILNKLFSYWPFFFPQHFGILCWWRLPVMLLLLNKSGPRLLIPYKSITRERINTRFEKRKHLKTREMYFFKYE